MLKYVCNNCHKGFEKKDSYLKHVNRKIKCSDRQYSNICLYCQKNFTTKSNVSRHIKNNCNIFKKSLEEKQCIYEELVKLKEENYELKNQLIYKKSGNVITNNITNNGVINNITIVAFGKEEKYKISEKDILNAVSKGFNTAEQLTKTIHFNNKYPEFHNVYIANIKENYGMTYDGKKWNLVHKKDLINNIYDDKKYFVQDNLEEFTKSLSSYKIESLKRWLKSDENDDKNIKDIKKRIELVLYNERDKPLKLKDKNIVSV